LAFFMTSPVSPAQSPLSDQPEPAPPAVPGAGSPGDIPPRGWKRILVATWKDASSDNLSLVAAGVAFYAFLAFVPLLSALALSYGLVAEPSSVVAHMGALTRLMPADAASLVAEQLESLTQTSDAGNGLGLVLALGIATYGASKGTGAVITALNIAYEVEERRGFVRRTLLTLSMTAAALLTLFLAVLAVSALHFLEAVAPELGGAARLGLKTLFFGLAAAAVVIVLAALYRYGPNRPDAPWRWITPGSALATIVWLAASFGFGLYVANFADYNATYGSLGAVIAFLTWLYLSAYIILFGAELNSILEKEVAREPAGASARADASPAPAEPGPALPLGGLVARLGLFSLLVTAFGRPKRRAA
jgi:membrane protein